MKSNEQIKHQREYFNKISAGYSDANIATISILERVKKMTAPYIKGDVLDIGNGGVISFDTKKSRSVTLADLAIDLLKSPRVLEHGKLKKLQHNRFKVVEANVMKMPFKNQAFDVVLMLNVAHHLSVPTTQSSRKNVGKAITDIKRVLKNGSTFILLENCPTPLFKVIYNFLFPFGFKVLSYFNKPLPYFLSENEITKLLDKNQFRIDKREQVPWGRKVYQPLFPLFSPPGWLWSLILKNKIFVCTKQKG